MTAGCILDYAIVALFVLGAASSSAQIKAGDHAWAERAETLVGERAEPMKIEAAIGAYRGAIESAPNDFEARWKLLRALHYAIDFSTMAADRQDALVEEAIELAKSSIDEVDSIDVGKFDRASLFFWSAIVWGTRAQRVGLFVLVREGVARRMHDYAQRALSFDPSVDQGGALRLLSRLHATLPRVPFVSGWVDRDRALPLAERGLSLYPGHPGNKLVVALALLELEPDRTAEARRLLEDVLATRPRPDFRVEDLAIREQARIRLETLDQGSS